MNRKVFLEAKGKKDRLWQSPNIRNSLLQEGSGSGALPVEYFARLDGSDKDDGDGVVPC